MKKLFVITRNIVSGGAEHVIAQLVNRFSEEGIECTVCVEYRHESFYPLDPRVHFVPLVDRESSGRKDIPEIYQNLRRLVLMERPDVVLALPEKVSAWTVLYLMGTGVPVVVSERNDPRRHPENKLKRLLRRLVYPFAAGYIFQTAQQAAYFSRDIQRRGVVLDNPLDVSALPGPFDGTREKRVVTAARLEPQKNLPLLIAAFAGFYRTHPDWTMTVYGEGNDEALLRAEAEASGTGAAIRFPGASKTWLEEVRGAGMFVLSSDFEGMPNALIEAMALGLPCVATDCPAGGCASLIEDGKNGLLVPVGGAEAMERAMCRIADEPGLAASLGTAGVRLRERLGLDTVSEKWRAYLERCCR